MTGDVYYSRDYRKGDEKELNGKGWKWMGDNNMFGQSADDAITSNLDIADVYTQGDSYDRVGFSGNNAKEFMSNMGYEFRPKTASVEIIETTTMVSEPHGPIYLTTVDESVIQLTGTYTTNKRSGSYTVLRSGPVEYKKIGLVTKQDIHSEIRQYDYSKNHVNRNVTSTVVKAFGEALKIFSLVK